MKDGAGAVRELAGEDRGTVALALVGTLAGTPLTAQLQAFRQAHPLIRLSLRTARRDEVSTLVQSGEAHLGLRYFADPRPELVSHPVRDEPLIVVCAGRSALVGDGPIAVRDLAGIPWVAFPTGRGSSGEHFARVLERQLLRCGLDGAEIIAADSLTAQKRLIEADFGLGLLPASSVEEELRLGMLRALPVADLQIAIPVLLIHRRHGHLGGAARRLMGVLTGGDA